MTQEALKLALKFVKDSECGTADLEACIKEALAQTQEPVCDKDPQGCWNVRCQLGKKCKNTIPQREWVGLTGEERADRSSDLKYEDIKWFSERCEEHPDHRSAIVTNSMIQQRLHEEIDELREYIEATLHEKNT